MRKIITVILSLAFIVCTLSGCGKSEVKETFYGEIFSEEQFENDCVKNAEQVTGYDMRTADRVKIAFEKSGTLTTVKVFDATTGKKSYEITATEVEIAPSCNDSAFTVTNGNEREVRRVSDGELLAVLQGGEEIVSVSDRLFRIGDSVIIRDFVSDDLQVLLENDPFVALPSLLGKTQNGNFYGIEENALAVYDTALRPIARLGFKKSLDRKILPLENGNFLLQEIVKGREDKYDFCVDNELFCVKQAVFAPLDNEIDEIKTDYVIEKEVEGSDDGLYCAVRKIKEGELSASTITVKIGKHGKIEKVFTKPLESDIIPRCKVESERYFTAGDCILNGKGEFVASVSAVNANEVYLVTTNAIYDYNKNKLFDIKAHDFSVDLVTDGAVFMKGKDGKRYLHKGNELVSLGSVLSVKNKGQALVEVRCESGYDYYNGYGEKLLSSESELFFAGEIGQSVYYRTAGYSQTWRFW